ncbi:hypothetical protein V6Z11_D03G071700 [Gossypium hirsutum]
MFTFTNSQKYSQVEMHLLEQHLTNKHNYYPCLMHIWI